MLKPYQKQKLLDTADKLRVNAIPRNNLPNESILIFKALDDGFLRLPYSPDYDVELSIDSIIGFIRTKYCEETGAILFPHCTHNITAHFSEGVMIKEKTYHKQYTPAFYRRITLRHDGHIVESYRGYTGYAKAFRQHSMALNLACLIYLSYAIRYACKTL